MAASLPYIDAKARVILAIIKTGKLVNASKEYNNDQSNVGKRAKIGMILELNNIRRCVEADIQIMESSVGQHTAPSDVTDYTCSTSLIH